jgi:hypothetical protein
MIDIISETENGRVFKCADCSKIHIEFKNLSFNFNDKEYKYFTNYLRTLNGQYWEYININSGYRRKIFIPIGHKNFHFLLNNHELTEFQRLFSKKEKKKPGVVSMSNYFVSDN